MAVTSETPTRLMRLPEVKQATTYSRASIYAKMERGEFPRPISLGGHAVAWLESEVSAWISERIKESRPDIAQVITIHKSPTADTRTCDFANTSKETLLSSSHQHIADVREALAFMVTKINQQAEVHDFDKISDIDGFHRDFVTGFKRTEWWDKHRKVNRHHLLQADGVPQDVNLIDVLDMICDCVMAGMARSGSVYPLEINEQVLRRAFDNTVELLKANIRVLE